MTLYLVGIVNQASELVARAKLPMLQTGGDEGMARRPRSSPRASMLAPVASETRSPGTAARLQAGSQALGVGERRVEKDDRRLSLRSEDEGRWRASCIPPRKGGDDVRKHERTEANVNKRQRRHGGARHGEDLMRKEGPEPTPQRDAKWCADDDTHGDGDRRLPRHTRGELALAEAKGLQQCQVAPTAPYRSSEGEAEGDDGTNGEPACEQDRRRTDGPVVLDLSRVLDRQDFDARSCGSAVRDGRECLVCHVGYPVQCR